MAYAMPMANRARGPRPNYLGLPPVQNMAQPSVRSVAPALTNPPNNSMPPGVPPQTYNSEAWINSNRPNANVNAPAFDPSNPYGYLTGDVRNTVLGANNRILGAAGNAGTFNPLGSPGATEAAGLQARQQGDALAAHAGITSRLFGLDPAEFGNAAIQQSMNTQGMTSDAMTNARLQTMLGAQDWARGLFGQNYQGALGMANNQQQLDLQRALLADQQHAARNQGMGGFLSALGSGLGTAVAGPVGGAAGGWLANQIPH